MSPRILYKLFLLLVAVTIAGCQVAENFSPTVSPTLIDPHHHIVDVNQTRVDPLSVSEFKIVEVQTLIISKEQVVLNQDQTFQAFTSCDEMCRIFVEDLRTGQIYEIQGLPLPWRPFSDLTWATSTVLVFDRWSTPHYGIHYAIDVVTKELILASPFTDEFP